MVPNEEMKPMTAKVRLNEKTVRDAQVPKAGGYRLIRDSEERGFALRVMESGVKAFVLAYMLNGWERRLTIGRWPTWSATAARERARELRRQIDRGVDPLLEKRERREAPTVGELVESFVERHAAKKKSGAAMADYLRKDVALWRTWKAANVQRRDVIELIEKKAATAPISANKLLTVIKTMFSWAVEKDILTLNPAAGVKAPTEEKARDRVLSEEEIRQFWERLDSAAMALECKVALRLILITAQRSGEILSMEDSELAGDWWQIPASKAKNGLAHSVYLGSLAHEEIQKLPGGRTFLFKSRMTPKPITVAGLGNSLADNLRHLGLENVTPHDLRRSAATWMARCGVSRADIGIVLNHTERGITKVYDRATRDAEKKRALILWERKLRQIVGKPAAAQVIEMPA